MRSDNHGKNNEKDQAEAVRAVDSARRAFAKVGVVAPVLMTLSSKTVLGATYHCTLSGMQSGNHSGAHDWTSPCGVGYSPGGWCENADKVGPGSSDGRLAQWLDAGVVPFTTQLVTEVKTVEQKCFKTSSSPLRYSLKERTVTNTTTTTGGVAGTPVNVTSSWTTLQSNMTSCSKAVDKVTTTEKKYILKHGVPVENVEVYDAIYKAPPMGGKVATPFFDSSLGTMWDVLDDNRGGLIFHAIADYLNAKLYEAGKATSFASVYSVVTSSDIVNLYKLGAGGISFTSSSGTLIDANFNLASYPNDSLSKRVQYYLEMLHH